MVREDIIMMGIVASIIINSIVIIIINNSIIADFLMESGITFLYSCVSVFVNMSNHSHAISRPLSLLFVLPGSLSHHSSVKPLYATLFSIPRPSLPFTLL